MDVNHLFLWVVGANSGMLLARSVVARRISGWAIKSGLLLAAMLALYFLSFEDIGWLVAGPWVILVLIPLLSTGFVNWLVTRHWYKLAWLVSELLAWLHPFDGGWRQPQIVRAMELLFSGQTAKAREVLKQVDQQKSPLALLARVLVARMEGNWEETLRWIRTTYNLHHVTDPVLIDVYMQALGETGQHDLLVAEFQRMLGDPQQHLDPLQSNLIRMRVAAFCGEVGIVERLLSGPLSRLAAETRQFWKGTALQAAGRLHEAEPIFQKLSQGRDQQLVERAASRLGYPLSVCHGGDESTRHAVFEQMAHMVGHESQYAIISSPGERTATVTWLIVLALLVVYGFEIPGGPENEENMFNLGALVVPFSMTGEYHRYVFSAFLHFGPLHLMMNVFGLQWFGQRLERAWGSLPMLICYIFTAIGSIYLFEPIMNSLRLMDLESQPVVLVGASGGVMGLIGALLGHLVVGHFSGRSRQVTREMGVLAAIVAMQTVFDTNSKEVSATVHHGNALFHAG